MLSNHNKNASSFRIIEPKRFQQAQQIPVSISNQQIPILTMRSNSTIPTNNTYYDYTYNQQQPQQQQQQYLIQQQQHQMQNQQQQQMMQNHQTNLNQRSRNLSDTDSSYIPETTSESGISDLDMSEKCNCCPYGYHIDVDFVTFLQTLGGKNLNKQLKKIQRKRNERLQRSMEYVIDEVEKIRQVTDGSMMNNNMNYTNSPRFNSTCETNSFQRSIVIPEALKHTINKIDQHINEDTEIFSHSNGNININNEKARRLLLQECSKSANARNRSAASFSTNINPVNNQINSNQNSHHLSSTSLPPPQERSFNLRTSQSFHTHHFNQPNFQQEPQYVFTKQYQPQHQHQHHQQQHNYQQQYQPQSQLPRRSYSSCAEPSNYNQNQNLNRTSYITETRRCMSNRASPIRQTQQQPINNITQSSSYRQINDARRSRSANRRSESKSKSPVEKQFFKREIKINLAQPNNKRSPVEFNEEQYMYNADEVETKTVTTTSVLKQPPVTPQPIRHVMTSSLLTLNQTQPEVQEEVLLNLFSCNNSGSISSDSSESLVEFDNQPKLNINEIFEKPKEPEKKIEYKQVQNLHLEKRLAELEKKLQKIPELEIKNNILLEEKQMLLKQLLNTKQAQKTPPPQPKPVETPKVYRSIGCDSLDIKTKRDIGVGGKPNTRDIGILNKLEEPREEINHMQTIITHLRDKLNEQTLIMQQQQIKPQTRDVAIMHVVDKVEEAPPKPELRDVAINHSTVVENKELIEKQTLIINTYIKEIETLRVENVKLSANLEELIKKHSKHVVTRGTHAPEQPILYSVGTNTKKCTTRDVQVMFTPKSRDVSLSTDRFYHTRDVGLACNIEDNETRTQIDELIEIKRKYEAMVEESLRNIKSYRDVNTLCRLDVKESRDVSLGCNLYPVKEYRDVSLKCNIDEELRRFRDVCIGCQMDKKPEQKDANIYVNTIEQVVKPVVRDFGTSAQIEDPEKLQLAREIALLKLPKPTRDVAISVDHRTRLMEDLLRNQYSSMDPIKTSNRQVNTDARQTRDSSSGPGLESKYFNSEKGCQANDVSQQNLTAELMTQKEIIEFERNKLLSLNTELKTQLKELEENLFREKKKLAEFEINSASKKQLKSQGVGMCSIYDTVDTNTTNISTVTANVNNYASNLNTSIEHEPIVRKRETEYEHHKITRTEPSKRSLEETVKLTASISTKPGDKQTETSIWTNKTEFKTGASASTSGLLKNEITIPIISDNLVKSKPPISPSKSSIQSTIITESVLNKDDDAVEKKNTEKIELKKPKGILKSTSGVSTTGQCLSNQPGSKEGTETVTIQRKALTFGENEICENFQSETSGSEYSLEENSQNTTLTNNEEDEVIEYETPIQQSESSTQNEAIIRKSKVSSANTTTTTTTTTTDLDDYELQEANCSTITDTQSKTSSSKYIQQEEDANESNVKKQTPVSVSVSTTPQSSKTAKQEVPKSFELELELHIACAILNDSLYEPLKADKTKVARALNLIQQDWFKLAAQKDSNPALVEEHLNAFYSRFSNLLLERIVNMADLNHNTALHYSVSTGNFEIVNLLLDSKVCDVNAQNKAGYTSIMLAAVIPIKDDFERMTLKRLFSEGNVNIKSTDSGQTALMLAVRHGNKDTVSLLLEAGADCNSQDKEGSTALMAACEHGHIDIVRLLLDNTNCDPDIKDNDGETAFDISKNKNRNDIIVLLYAHSSKLRSHHPAIQFSKSRPRIGSAGSQGARK